MFLSSGLLVLPATRLRLFMLTSGPFEIVLVGLAEAVRLHVAAGASLRPLKLHLEIAVRGHGGLAHLAVDTRKAPHRPLRGGPIYEI